MQVSKYLNPMENKVFQFSVYDFHSVKTSLTKHVFLVWIGYELEFVLKTIKMGLTTRIIRFEKKRFVQKKLEWVNERGLRAVFCDWNLAYEDLLIRANLFLYNMRLQDIASFMYKVKHRLLPSNVVVLFRGTPSGYSTSRTQIFISPESILSTMANIP